MSALEKKRILVTGGAGFIGSNFIHWVLETSDLQLACVDHLGYAGNLENLAEIQSDHRFRFYRQDICDESGLRSVFEQVKPDTVIHFAAESHVDRSIQSSAPFIESNVRGTQVLLDLSCRYPVKRFLHVSTDEVYGEIGANDAASVETDPLRPRNPYSASKAASDLLVQSYVHTHGFPALITRCSNNYGPYQFPEKLIPLLITNALENRPVPVYGDGRQIRDWIYVDDHCEAIWQLVGSGQIGEVYNIGGHNQPTNLEIVKTVLNILDKPESLITFVKDRPGHDRRYNLNDDKLIAQTGFKERISLDSGLCRTVDWYLNNQNWWRHVKSGEYRRYYERQYGKT